MKRSLGPTLVLAALVAAPAPARADEGFWPLDRFPHARVQRAYGTSVDQAVLDRAARATTWMSSGSGGFVSPRGLFITKHGNVKPCLHSLRDARKTTARFAGLCRRRALRAALPLLDRLVCEPLDRSVEFDYVERGYLARTQAEEMRCPTMGVQVLVGVEDVTARVQAELAPLAPEKKAAARRALVRRLESACTGKGTGENRGQVCDVAALHGGARYELHTLRSYDDVRVVFAPEMQVADFGDLTDHITFPDHDLKVAFLRVYDHRGRPLATPDHFRWSTHRLREGELTLMVGHPRDSLRRAPSARLAVERDQAAVMAPTVAEWRALALEIAGRRPRVAPLIDIDAINHNVLFADSRVHNLNYDLITQRSLKERALLEELAIRKDPGLEELRAALTAANDALTGYSASNDPLYHFVLANAAGSALLGHAVAATLMSEGAQLDARAQLRDPGQIDDEIETARLALALRRLAGALLAGDPVLRKILGDQLPRERARSLVAQSRFGDPAFRRTLADGGVPAIKASNDPMLILVRSIFPDLMITLRRRNSVTTLSDRASELIGAALHRLYGDDVYPEGTATIRASYGAARSYRHAGKTIHPVTTLGDLFRLSYGDGPYQLPARWREARARMDLSAPLNVATTHDGMSGSAVLLDRSGAVVGLMFNGNRQFPGMREGYDETRRRVVSVHAAAVVEVLRHVYGAHELLRELGVN